MDFLTSMMNIVQFYRCIYIYIFIYCYVDQFDINFNYRNDTVQVENVCVFGAPLLFFRT